ncbi:MAG TPA: hypothetical protein VHW44_17640 [Pseudonocardiaceae bacterium]|jgi:hypothetical protein|nr:hypothetical protein [Pseudonocardiaceae bacterium]
MFKLSKKNVVRTAVVAAVGMALALFALPANASTSFYLEMDKGQTLTSGSFVWVYPTDDDGTDEVKFIMLSNGNLEENMYSTSGAFMYYCWAANTSGAGNYATYQKSNGALIVFNEVGTPLWSSGATGGSTVSLNSSDGALFVGTKRITSSCVTY